MSERCLTVWVLGDTMNLERGGQGGQAGQECGCFLGTPLNFPGTSGAGVFELD